MPGESYGPNGLVIRRHGRRRNRRLLFAVFMAATSMVGLAFGAGGFVPRAVFVAVDVASNGCRKSLRGIWRSLRFRCVGLVVWLVDGVQPAKSDFFGVGFCLVGMAVIMFAERS